jgi:hypothetical protein
MPLFVFHCHQTAVNDLSPIEELPVQYLYCDFQRERDAEVLRRIRTLQTINGKPAKQFWMKHGLPVPAQK